MCSWVTCVLVLSITSLVGLVQGAQLSREQVLFVANASEIYSVLQNDLLLRNLYRLGVDDVKYALSFAANRVSSQMGFPWIANVDQTLIMSQLTDAFLQLPLYAPSTFVAPVGMGVAGFVQPVPTPWKLIFDYLKDYKLTSGTGHGCPEFTNMLYDKTRHQLECVPVDGISMTLDCESESAPWTFAVVISSIGLAVIVILFITAVVIAANAKKELDKVASQYLAVRASMTTKLTTLSVS